MGKGIAALGGAILAATLMLAAAPASAEADVVWLCKPGMPDNPCEIPQDTTYMQPDGADQVVTPPNGPRQIDCFYVYPTVSNQPTPNANKNRDPELESIAKYQAARFSQQCRVFAPIYRQVTLAALGAAIAGASSGADRELAYQDVLEAWREYLAMENRGRGVVLVGHSQGTFMLRELLRREIEVDRAQRSRVVSALLLGGNVTVRAGDVVGGDFQRTPLCTQEGQTGCVVAYSTFAEDPPEDARFGVTGPGLEVACTDPRPLAGVADPFRVVVPSEPFAPGTILAGIIVTSQGPPPSAATTWASPSDRFDGSCQTISGAHVLRIEPQPGSRRPMWYPEPGWGTHLIDVNVALDPLVALVARQAAAWTNLQEQSDVSPASPTAGQQRTERPRGGTQKRCKKPRSKRARKRCRKKR